MTGILNLLAGAVSSVVKDTYFNLVSLLLPGNGTNGAQNNTFLDSSTNNFTITRNGNTTQGTFSPFSQTGWSNFFSNAGSTNISAVTGANTSPGTGVFCAELWYYKTDTNNVGLFGNLESSTDTQWAIVVAGGTIRFQGWNTLFITATEPSLNQWHHVAVCRSGTTMSMFVDGARVATGTVSNNFSATTDIRVGGPNGVGYFNGYISNARFVKGSSVYDPSQTSITVPTTPLTNIANTTFLTCQSNRFVDNSTANSGSGYAITTLNGPSVQAFSPFAPTAAYSAATVGGSGYFDGSGDFLSLASNAAWNLDGDFTVEFWAYITSFSDNRLISVAVTNGLAIYVTTSGFPVIDRYGVGPLITSSTAVSLNSWNHISAVRSGSSMTLYLNGSSVGTATSSHNFVQGALYIATDNSGRFHNGWMSGIKWVKGTATAPSGIPTAPPTNTTNTQLLCNFTNAGITDATAKNVLETVGNAQISTTQSKFGGSSILFDGTGDYLVTPSSPNNILGSGDFTVEFWAYPSNTSSAYRALVASENYDSVTGGWSIYQNGTTIEVWLTGSLNLINATSALTANTWQHVALSRSSGTVRLFVNGTSVGSASNSAAWTGQRIFVGDNNVSGTDYFYNGYIDDFRITRGYARYTANFTAPTAAFPLQ